MQTDEGEESHYFHTLSAFEELVKQYGAARVLTDMMPYVRIALTQELME